MPVDLPLTIDGTLRIEADGDGAAFHCESCGCNLCSASENWKENVSARTMGPGDERLPPYVTLHEELRLVEYTCPDCDSMLDVSVERVDEPPIMDFEVTL